MACNLLAVNRDHLSNSHPQLNVRVTHELDQAVRVYADRHGVSISAVVRAALRDYVHGGVEE